MKKEQLEALAKSTLLSGLATEEVEALIECEILSPMEFEKDENILSPDKKCEKMGFRKEIP